MRFTFFSRLSFVILSTEIPAAREERAHEGMGYFYNIYVDVVKTGALNDGNFAIFFSPLINRRHLLDPFNNTGLLFSEQLPILSLL